MDGVIGLEDDLMYIHMEAEQELVNIHMNRTARCVYITIRDTKLAVSVS